MKLLGGDLQRRSILAACGTAIGLAGCLNQPEEMPAQDDQPGTPTSTPTATQTKSTAPDEETTPTNSEEATQTETEEEPATETPEDGTDADWESGWYIRPDSSPANTPARLQCEEDGTTRYKQRFDEEGFEWGDGTDWGIRVSDLSGSYGSSVTVRLKNVSDAEETRGADGKYNLQVKTEAGWEDVRVWHEENGPPIYPGEAHNQEAGEATDWEIPMTEDGIEGDEVCPELQAGRYRFAYFGFDGDTEAAAIGVAFDLTR